MLVAEKSQFGNTNQWKMPNLGLEVLNVLATSRFALRLFAKGKRPKKDFDLSFLRLGKIGKSYERENDQDTTRKVPCERWRVAGRA